MKKNVKQVKEVKEVKEVKTAPTTKDNINFTMRAMRKHVYRCLKMGIETQVLEILMKCDEELTKAIGRKALEDRIHDFTAEEMEMLRKMLAPTIPEVKPEDIEEDEDEVLDQDVHANANWKEAK